MRQAAVIGPRPASRARARSPAGPNTRSSQAAAYGFQSPGGRPGNAAGTTSTAGVPSRTEYNPLLPTGAPSVRTRGSLQGQPGGDPAAAERRASRSSRLSVVVRKRPMNRREVQAQQQDVVLCRNSAVVVREQKHKVDLTRYVEEHNFQFDQSFDETVTNEQLYCACVRPIIDAVFNRAKCTCFAYGQTGSGKTFTMMGPPKRQGEGIADRDRIPGIFLLAAQDIFRCLKAKEHSHLGVYIAFYEIYCGKLFDLLNNRQILHARENAKSNVVIVGLQEHPVENVQQLMEVIEFGLNSRTTGVTGANVDSSRSHAILQISLKDVRSKEEGVTPSHRGRDEEVRLKEHGKISFIDLAGSERGADTLDTDRQTRMDGAEINKSLLALKECIRALDQQLDHTPFRGSKLTQVLKDSFVGSNCRTVMIANVSPCGCAVEHSLNTLRYAYRVKELRRGGSSGAGLGSLDLGSLTDGVPPLNGPGELGMEEESSDEESAGGAETPPTAQQQQLRVAHLSAAAQTLSSPRDARLFEPPTRGGLVAVQQQHHQSPEEVAAVVVAAASAPAPEAAAELAVARSDAHMGHGPLMGHGGHGHPHACGGVAPGIPAAQLAQELAPEVALEPVGGPQHGCSQATLDELARQHDRLIGTILAEEEELITAHRQHIDMMVELIKEEMMHLTNVDRPGSDVDAYVTGLDRILRLKDEYIGEIRQRVDLFKDHLQQEDALSRKFQSLASSSS